MSEEKIPGCPNRKELEEAIGVLQNVHKAQSMAQQLKEKASKAASPAERERLFKEAYAKEVEANGHSKVARRMQSGTWQGLFGGGGIGAGVGLGVGAVVGTLLGGILSVPTIALGGLVGSGVGAVHGPWITVGDIRKRFEDATPAEVADALEQEQEQEQEQKQKWKASGNSEQASLDSLKEGGEDTAPALVRKKPRKIEIRSKTAKHSDSPSNDTAPP